MEDEIRLQTIHPNKESALIALNLIRQREGKIVRVRYMRDSKVDALVALGTEDGIGPEFYSLISDQSIPSITSILSFLPDVSEVVSGSIYLYRVLPGPWRIYYLLDSDLTDKEVTESFYFTCLEDGKYYYLDSETQRLVDITKNLTDKASFQGIIVLGSLSEYESLSSPLRDHIYLISDGTRVTDLRYNGLPIEFGENEIYSRLDTLEGIISAQPKLTWQDE